MSIKSDRPVHSDDLFAAAEDIESLRTDFLFDREITIPNGVVSTDFLLALSHLETAYLTMKRAGYSLQQSERIK